VHERLFEPLGMTASNFSIAESKYLPDCSLAYGRRDGNVIPIAYYERQSAIGPCGAIVSNITDMRKWVALHIHDGLIAAQRLVSLEQMQEMHSPQILYREPGRYPEMPNKNSGYGLGWDIDEYRGHAMVNHGGGINGFSTYAAFMPDLKVGVVVLCNLDSAPAVTRSLAWNVFDRFLHADQAPWSDRYKLQQKEDEAASALAAQLDSERQDSGAGPSHGLDRYAGEYEHPAYGPLVLAYDGHGLAGTYNERGFALEHYHHDIFRLAGEYLGPTYATFTTGLNADVVGVSIPFEPTARPIVFQRVYPEMRDPRVLQAVVGRYGRPFGSALVIRLGEHEKLLAIVPALDGRQVELVPTGKLEFAMKGMDPSSFGISFTIDQSGVVHETICRAWGAAYVFHRT
jgi:hypothetical protein